MPHVITAEQNAHGAKYGLVYCTTSTHKQEEMNLLVQKKTVVLPSLVAPMTRTVREAFDITYRSVDIVEILSCDLCEMVHEKALRAYESVQVPLIVEHAGLIFESHLAASYPGGLTQPMWDALDADQFIRETNSAGRRTIARAVVGYCDGIDVRIFVGETTGVLADAPRGDRAFYWDTIFIPDDPINSRKETYAELTQDPKTGLKQKIQISQSAKAMSALFEYVAKNGSSELFPM